MMPQQRAVPTIRIDQEFRQLIPPLSDIERDQLEANLATDGCRDPLVLWDDLIIDGHNRYEICEAHGWTYQTVQQPCTGREDAKIWIIRNQLGRRNLQPYQRAELALALKPLIAAQAKSRLVTSTGGAVPQPFQNSGKAAPIHTQREIAKAAGLSHDTIAKVEAIAAEAPEDVKQQLRRGDISIDRAYQGLKRGRPTLPDTRRHTLRIACNDAELFKFRILAELNHSIDISVMVREIVLDELNAMLSDWPRKALIETLTSHGLTEPEIQTLIASL